jgi:hypothetical protein
MPGTSLPYLVSPGSLKTALERIRAAATPDRVTQDFVNTILQIKGGTGAAIIPFLKKVGLVASDGAPTELYKRFRNPSIGGTAIADAIKIGYGPLKNSNEYFYKLPETDLMNLVLQVTGLDHDNKVAKLVFSTLQGLKSFADFDSSHNTEAADTKELAKIPDQSIPPLPPQPPTNVGLNLSYTINLNLPATSDQAVFNAIFKSLKENLISDE